MEQDRVKRDSDEIKQKLQIKLHALESDYIAIDKHEQILNDELSRQTEKLNEQLKKIKEQLEKEISERLDNKDKEKEKIYLNNIKKLKEQTE